MTSREAVRAGARALVTWRAASLAAVLAAATAMLAGTAAAERAGEAWRVAIAHAEPSLLLRAGVTRFVGLAFAGLVWLLAEAVALTAYAGPPPGAVERGPFLRGLQRLPAMVTVRAVELTVELMLVVGAAAVLARRAAPLPVARAALAGALLLLPLAMVGFGTFAAARVAVTLAARGLPPAVALVHGYDVVLRRLPSLVRLALALLVATLPLTLLAGLCSLNSASLFLSTVRAVSVAAVVLWSYAALAAMVGRDPRLAGG